jgi:hypothetical protein
VIRKIVTTLIALAVVGAGSLAAAPPSNAASQVSYCFKYTNGYPYARLPVVLQLSLDTIDWYPVLAMETDPHGCGAFDIFGKYANTYARAVAEHHVDGTVHSGSPAYWTGTSPFYALPGQGAVHLGTGAMDCIPRVPYACVGF